MEGFTVVTSDDAKFGEVKAERGDNLIVEQGRIFKSRVALPRAFAHVDEAERVVRTTISKQVLESAPKLDGDELDEFAVAEHYGLAAAESVPDTQGYGEVLPDDPARTADDDARRAGLATPDEQRAAIREGAARSDSPPPSPGVTGGDRARDFD
jgi:hypothetical protein